MTTISRFSRTGRLLAGGFAAALAFAGAGLAHAQQGPGWGMHGGHEMADPARAAQFMEHRLARIVPDATEDQKTRLKAIFQSAMNDIKPLREKTRANRQQMTAVLTQRSIDRSALESLRGTQMQLADQISRRMTQAFADAAEVLTPDQRARVAAAMQKRMERMR